MIRYGSALTAQEKDAFRLIAKPLEDQGFEIRECGTNFVRLRHSVTGARFRVELPSDWLKYTPHIADSLGTERYPTGTDTAIRFNDDMRSYLVPFEEER